MGDNMILIETEKDLHGMWNFTISAGEKSSLDVYAMSNFDYESDSEAEMAALKWASDSWL